ncbi:phytanoyl-CoA dioxygenase family protein [Paenibacillus sp. FJAT-26967]|uniref:phytanoyl-CoA dioxygenase family protein n=1 Tax=Paenibacillus sp. FJAT-26967 TaxID=1729690 RepID=UPI0008391245|nr:phytanoyl-CoA dioxygenase family protein [Paenibacillus sp. FJAT-26967]
MTLYTLSGQEKKFFEEEGYVVLKGVYSLEEVRALKDEYHNIWLDSVAGKTIVQDPGKPLTSLFPRMKDLHKENEGVRRFVWQKTAASCLEQLIGEQALLVSTNYYFKPPGAKGMPYHQDNYGIGVLPGTCYAIWASLDKAGVHNGGMRLIRHTHTSELQEPRKVYTASEDTFAGYVQTLEVPEGHQVIELETEPGDIVIYHGNLIHDSADNNSEVHFRHSIISHFAAESAEKTTLNFNYLMDKEGRRVRKRMNAGTNILRRGE